LGGGETSYNDIKKGVLDSGCAGVNGGSNEYGGWTKMWLTLIGQKSAAQVEVGVVGRMTSRS
jgi:hypothetical protein